MWRKEKKRNGSRLGYLSTASFLIYNNTNTNKQYTLCSLLFALSLFHSRPFSRIPTASFAETKRLLRFESSTDTKVTKHWVGDEYVLMVRERGRERERERERRMEIFSWKEKEKFGCIRLRDCHSFCLEIYMFNLFDDPKHNDHHPHLHCIIPFGFIPFPTTKSGIPFHTNPNTISLKPTTPTPPHGIVCGRFSTVLGFNTFLYHIAKWWCRKITNEPHSPCMLATTPAQQKEKT